MRFWTSAKKGLPGALDGAGVILIVFTVGRASLCAKCLAHERSRERHRSWFFDQPKPAAAPVSRACLGFVGGTTGWRSETNACTTLRTSRHDITPGHRLEDATRRGRAKALNALMHLDAGRRIAGELEPGVNGKDSALLRSL